jgi:hypothetical protein
MPLQDVCYISSEKRPGVFLEAGTEGEQESGERQSIRSRVEGTGQA